MGKGRDNALKLIWLTGFLANQKLTSLFKISSQATMVTFKNVRANP